MIYSNNLNENVYAIKNCRLHLYFTNFIKFYLVKSRRNPIYLLFKMHKMANFIIYHSSVSILCMFLNYRALSEK